MRKRDFEAELGRFLEVYNAAWERNWGFVPLTGARSVTAPRPEAGPRARTGHG